MIKEKRSNNGLFEYVHIGSCLGIPQEELESVAGETNVWESLPSDPTSDKGKTTDGWMLKIADESVCTISMLTHAMSAPKRHCLHTIKPSFFQRGLRTSDEKRSGPTRPAHRHAC